MFFGIGHFKKCKWSTIVATMETTSRIDLNYAIHLGKEKGLSILP
jgi:hypothetical protein